MAAACSHNRLANIRNRIVIEEAFPAELLTGGPKTYTKVQRSIMGIRRHTDDTRATTPTNGANPTPRAKIGVVERWKQQLLAGEDLEGTSEPSSNDESGSRSPPRSRDRRDVHGLSDLGVLINLVILGLVCVGGYFLLMKLVEISRQEDCFLGGGRNCARLQLPSNR
jgi:hypothetical protein